MIKKLLVLLFPIALFAPVATKNFPCQRRGCKDYYTGEPRAFSSVEALLVHEDWHKGYCCKKCGLIFESSELKRLHDCPLKPVYN